LQALRPLGGIRQVLHLRSVTEDRNRDRKKAMKAITQFQSEDGKVFDSADKCGEHERLCIAVEQVMKPLEIPKEQSKGVSDGIGWYQHDINAVYAAREGILALARPKYAKSFPVFNTPGKDAHPLSVIGRILSDCTDWHDPIGNAWGRFAQIDEQGREHQQCYFAYTNGPEKEHVCLNP